MSLVNCYLCSSGMHSSCLGISCACSLRSHALVTDPSPTSNEGPSVQGVQTDTEDDSRAGRHVSRNGRGTTRRDATLKDQQSTGRKRAARMYPLNRDSPCEWRNKSNCGGGLSPILGCVAGTQEARHHGPDKSVSNNEEGNVHRICHACHNRWHAANNAEYDWNSTVVQAHSPQPHTPKEAEKAMEIHMTYVVTKNKRIKD